MKTYTVHQDYFAENNSVIDVLHLDDFVDAAKYRVDNACINIGGWQSWNPCTEVFPGKKQPRLNCRLIKQWNAYLVFPQSGHKPSRNIVLGQFVTYLRWNDLYLVFASVGNVNGTLPPVQFVFNRSQNTVSFEICDKGNNWKTGDVTGRIEIFIAQSYFECKDKLAAIFGKEHFNSVNWLGKNPAGWESWYNHYANINQNLIKEDLKKLSGTENIISLGNYSSKIFQIDDGWEKALGDWQTNLERFPENFSEITSEIEKDGYIPGLWLAPFIIDSRSKTATEHPDWLLKDHNGKLVPAGYNPLWGKDGTFYCLDLSRDEVIAHLDSIMESVINKWGFRYIKLDFLYAGMLYGNYAQQTASYKLFTRALKTITSRTENKDGKPVAYLGCGCPFELCFKYLPLSRIGCDTYEKWKNPMMRFLRWNGRNEAYLNVVDTLGHALWDNTIFINDPDVVFVREENCTLTENQKLLIAGINSMFGSQFMYSDDPGLAGEPEKLLTQKIFDFIKKYDEEEFGIKQTSEDIYEIFSKSGKYKGEVNLKTTHLKMSERE
ncbi:glycoside hydrolase family 36 protein [Treponema bryantii]|uniref:glycoside hydrolase family 36 protein n=1 Tax=Treponema bryantii TaxID=163 RepID=UPI002B2E13B4|nr:hypothetical protein TRBR_15280 [Treponema bryantii]